MQKKLTLSIDETVYDGLHRMVGRGKISQFIEDLVRPCVEHLPLGIRHPAMAADQKRETEALEWSNALAQDIADETR